MLVLRLHSSRVRVFLGVPYLKAIVVEPKRSPVIRANSHRHPLVPRNGRSAAVAGFSDSMPVAQFDEASSWQSAVLDPLANHVPEESRIHAMEKLRIIAIPDEIVSFPTSA